MNALIDTNVILDDLLNREPERADAGKIMGMVTDKKIFGYITANTLTDIYNLIEKHKSKTFARKAIKIMLNTLQVIAVDGVDCLSAIEYLTDDFEGALIMVCADKASIDYIVTNDRAFLAEPGLLVPAISPFDFLSNYCD